MLRKISLVFVFLAMAVFVSSCASTGANRQTQSQLLGNLAKGDYKTAENFVNDAKFYPQENSALLRLLERGTVQYLAGNYYQALKTLEQAQKLSDELFTKSISKGAAAAIGSSSADNYYGERYERSLIRFYESLVNYNLYKKGEYEAYSLKDKDGKTTQFSAKKLSDSEKKNHLSQARSILLEWDTLLYSYDKELAGKATYKSDLVQKLYGAFIHEEFGTSEDRQIALQLYKDAKDILLKNYNLYASFNNKSSDFAKNFDKLAKMPLDKVKADFIDPSINEKDLDVFIDQKITKLSSNNKDNFTLVLKDGFIAPKKAKKVIIGFITGNANMGLHSDIPKDAAFIPLPVDILLKLGGKEFYDFLNTVFKLGSYSLPTIDFEIAYIEDNAQQDSYTAELNGKEFNIVLLDPLANIAYRELDAKSAGAIAKTASVVAAKHAAALYASYQTYKAATKGLGDDFKGKATKKSALTAFGIAYKAAVELINESANADLRYWSSLANNIRIGSANIPDGEYKLTIYSNEKGNKRKVHERKVNVAGNLFVDINL